MFDFTSVRVTFLVVEVAQGEVFLDVLLFFLVNIISPFSFSSTCFPYHKKKGAKPGKPSRKIMLFRK
jgi:hypothetical protein